MKKILYFASIFSYLGVSAQVNLTANLKVCMPFNGNATDLSGNGNNGTVSNATLTADRFGNANKAYQFSNAFNSNISISSFAALAPTNELTISMWALSDQTTSNCLFILNPDNQTDRCVGCAQYVNGVSTIMIWDYGDISSGGRITVGSIPTDLTNWHHYVYIISESGNIKQMYLDGNLNSNTPYSLSCTNKNLPFYIGGGFSNGTNTKIMWNGKIDDVCIYNRALNSAEVSALFVETNTCFDVGIEELETIQHLQVYPIMSTSGLYAISSDRLSNQSVIEVVSMDGKLIKRLSDVNGSDVKLDLTEVSQGMYLLKLITESGINTRKIIKD